MFLAGDFVIQSAAIRPIKADNPIATCPPSFVHWAIAKADTANNMEGKNILPPIFLNCFSLNSSEGLVIDPAFTCFVTVKPPIIRRSEPTKAGGITLPNINIIARIHQNKEVPTFAVCVLSFIV